MNKPPAIESSIINEEHDHIPSDPLYTLEQWKTIQTSIQSRLAKTRFVGSRKFDHLCRAIKIAAGNYRTAVIHEQPQHIKRSKFKSRENRHLLREDLAALQRVRKFFDNANNRLAMLQGLETLPFAETGRVLDKATQVVEENLLQSTRPGAIPKNARKTLIAGLAEIWRKYTMTEPTVTVSRYSSTGKDSAFVTFALSVAKPILIREDMEGLEEALRQAGKKPLKRKQAIEEPKKKNPL